MNKQTSTCFLICLVVILFVASLAILLDNGVIYNSNETKPSGLLWQKNIENFSTGLDAANGKLFIIDISGTICCYDSHNGVLIWKESIGGYWGSGVTASSSMVYGGKSGTEVGAVNLQTGKFQWIVGTLYDSAWSKRAPSNITVFEDRLYVTSENFEVYNAASGELLWENENNSFDRNSNVTHPAWIVAWPFEGNRLFGVGGGLNLGYYVYRLNPDTGDVLWSKPCSYVFLEMPVVYENQVIIREISAGKTNLLSIDENSGDLLWKYEVDADVFQPTAYNGLLFFGASDDSFYALNLDNGTLAWKSQVDSQNITTSVNVDNPLEGLPIRIDVENQKIVGGFAVTTQIFVNGSSSGDEYRGIMCSLDVETGNLTWSSHFDGEGDISNHVYDFALTENNLYLSSVFDFRIFSKTTGNLIESQHFEHALSSPVSENGKVFVAADLWIIAYD